MQQEAFWRPSTASCSQFRVSTTNFITLNVEKNNEIIRELRASKRLFEDPEFPADDTSLTYAHKKLNYKWLRPKELDADPEFVKDGFSRFDINQGELENCWILAAVAAITQRPDLLSQVILPDQTLSGAGYCGAFRFRFRPFGREVEIMVDDRLPTKDGQLVYAAAHEGEYWVCLLEKALAKLHGCYESLIGGLELEAMADLTGGVCELIPFKREDGAKVLENIKYCLSKKLSAGAATHTEILGENLESLGLTSGHEYIVTGTVQIPHNGKLVDLIRICNPWGPLSEFEWRGKWNDNDPRWTPEQMKLAGLVKQDDGENWMELSDFMKFFEFLTVLHLARNLDNGVTGAEWNGKYIYGEWYPGQKIDEFFEDNTFLTNFCDGSNQDGVATVVISLEEPGQRNIPLEKRRFSVKAVDIYKGANCLRRPVYQVAQHPEDNQRSVVFRVSLPPGDYTVVPQTESPLNGKRLEFLLRIYTES
ncbi:hypothetical protein BOX15_Mlig005293g1 [Macrostomum lignano]|uniref:Calpain catalytic domain-containing protein n=2 Tax=Macrostomum lignano TaxID=282301 RepID=A0A267EVI0_9PLAT|nr:hypothetical protein BOX15_Mlig005293g3 [Macrostomum lignano]PAA65521.1 hypothetical protein BOX15_Mlig005293g1 [Macrostomum lignano]